MALNWVKLDNARNFEPLNQADKTTVRTSDDSDVRVKYKETEIGAKGKVWLTEERLIFVRDPSKTSKADLDTLSIPLVNILSTKFEQPPIWKGTSNYLLIDVKPTIGGGLTEGTKVEMRFNDQGPFNFLNAVQKLRELAIGREQARRNQEDELPTYAAPGYPESSGPSGSTSGSASGSGWSHIATGGSSVPSDAPPNYEA